MQKPLEEFNKNSSKKDGLQTLCRICSKNKYKEYYKNSDKEKARLRKNSKLNRKKIQEIVRQAKKLPCSDCEIEYPYYVMDFDHLEDKVFDIGTAVARAYSIIRIQEEIAKCEVVCSNCHRIRTHNRRAA